MRARITLAMGAARASANYTLTPNASGDGGSVDIAFGLSGGSTVAAGSGILRGTTFSLISAGIGITAPDADGACPASANAAITRISLAEGGEAAHACVALLSNPRAGAPVLVSCSAADAMIRVSPASLAAFTAANWQTPQRISVRAADNNIAGGARSDTLTCSGRGASGGDYAQVSAEAPLAISDADAVAAGGMLAATSSISENGGAQAVLVTATIDGAIAPGADCTVRVTTQAAVGANTGSSRTAANPGGTVAVAGSDYEGAAVSIANFVISAGRLSGESAAVMVTPIVDADAASEAIPFSAAASACSGVDINFGRAETLIIDKGDRESLQNVNAAVLPVLSQLGMAAAMRDIAARAGASRTGGGAGLRLAGNDSAEGVLLGHMKTAAALDDARGYDWRRALAGSSFAMPLSGPGGLGEVALWASGDYRSLRGDNGVTDWKGNAYLLNLGADARLGGDMLVGAMLSFIESSVDYSENSLGNASVGKYTQESIAFRPYFAQEFDFARVWGSLGYARGEVDLKAADEAGARSSDTTESSLSLGVERDLAEGLRIKADLAGSAVDVAESKEGEIVMVGAQGVESMRARLLLVGKNTYAGANGTITPNVEIGMRYDMTESDKATAPGADEFAAREDSSTGAEASLGVDIVTGGGGGGGVNLSLKTRFYNGNDYDEWGVSGVVEKKTGAGGRGLWLRLRPAYGDAGGDARGLWERSFAEGVRGSGAAAAVAGKENTRAPSMRGAFGYGFAAPGGRGVVTPYVKVMLGGVMLGGAMPGGDAQNHTFGLRWEPHSRFDVDAHAAGDAYRIGLHWFNKRLLDVTLSGERTVGAAHALVLKGTLDF